jgi:hypothetical protein
MKKAAKARWREEKKAKIASLLIVVIVRMIVALSSALGNDWESYENGVME